MMLFTQKLITEKNACLFLLLIIILPPMFFFLCRRSVNILWKLYNKNIFDMFSFWYVKPFAAKEHHKKDVVVVVVGGGSVVLCVHATAASHELKQNTQRQVR